MNEAFQSCFGYGEGSFYHCRRFPGSSLRRSLIAGCAAIFAAAIAPSQNPWLRT